jgi:hypothetical protein
MKDLRIGEQIQNINKMDDNFLRGTEKVLTFIDFSRSKPMCFCRMYTSKEEYLETTPGHLVFVKEKLSKKQGKFA